jgi:dTDP-4-amino-4,6-dideoxygalactose transaminase
VHDDAEEAAILEVLKSGEWGGYPMPNKIAKRFAERFARYHDCEFGQCVANGTVSLEIALQAVGVERDAEVIVPAYTFEATAAAVLFAGAVPVFVDIEPDTYCISPDAAEAAITNHTQAILPVHLGMNIADMDGLQRIARRHGLKIVEDCAHAHGARWRDRGVGSLGDAGSFSFQSSKLMTSGEGGIVLTNDDEVMDYLFALTNCGRQRPERRRDVSVIGHNYRMTEFQAALLEVQLERLPDQQETRNRNIGLLESGLAEVGGLSLMRKDARVTSRATYAYVFRYDAAAFDELPRDAFVAGLSAEGIPCDGFYFEPVFRSDLFKMDARRYPAWSAGYKEPECPVTLRASYNESIWLPQYLFLGGSAEVGQVVEAIHKVAESASTLVNIEHPSIARQQVARSRRPAAADD